MTKNTVADFTKPREFSPEPLTDVLCAGARKPLDTAVRAEVPEFPTCHIQLLEGEGHQPFGRHGFLPVREVLTGIGKVSV
tara:strand:- start:198 stop:437 length:240 start_codon:yes stop_codon:yes gene_type:complete